MIHQTRDIYFCTVELIGTDDDDREDMRIKLTRNIYEQIAQDDEIRYRTDIDRLENEWLGYVIINNSKKLIFIDADSAAIMQCEWFSRDLEIVTEAHIKLHSYLESLPQIFLL